MQCVSELFALYGLLGQLYGGQQLCAAPCFQRCLAALLHTAAAADSPHSSAAHDALAALCAEHCSPKQPLASSAPLPPLPTPDDALEAYVVPLLRVLRSPSSQAHAAAAAALRAVFASFPSPPALVRRLRALALPICAAHRSRPFGPRANYLEALTALLLRCLDKHNEDVEQAPPPPASEIDSEVASAALTCAFEDASSEQWTVRRNAAHLIEAVARCSPAVVSSPARADALRAVAQRLRHDRTEEVRTAWQRAASVMPEACKPAVEEQKRPPRPDSSLATRSPVRSRPMLPEFEKKAEQLQDSDVHIFVPRHFQPPQEVENGSLLREIQALRQQQQELLATVNSLCKAVESGMRTLNGRVRALEEQMQDLTEAFDDWTGQGGDAK